MNRTHPVALILTLASVPLSAGAAPAAAPVEPLRAVGILGNSGESGPGLVRVAPYPKNERRAGVAVGPDLTLWTSGGDAINRLALSGEQIDRFPLEPAGSLVDSRTFAAVGDTLYFLAEVPGQGSVLFDLPMRKGGAARPSKLKLPPRHGGDPAALAPQPLDGRLLVLVPRPNDEVDAATLDPATGEAAKRFTIKGRYPGGVAVDAKAGVIFAGGHFPDAFVLAAFRKDGTPLPKDFPVPCMKTPAIPTQFRGFVSLAGGALWDTAWYGFLSRHGTDGRNAPGRVVEWHHELDYPTQVAEVAAGGPRYDALAISCATPAAYYYARWDRQAQRLELARRLGAMPDLLSLGLSADGWVTAGTARTQLWWGWEDGRDAPPRKSDIHVAVSPPFFQGDSALAVAKPYELSNNSPLCLAVFPREPHDRNEASRVVPKLPLADPVGLSVRVTPGRDAGVLYLTDGKGAGLWATDIHVPSLRPDEGKWRQVPVTGGAFSAPTDVVALTDGRLLVADRGRIAMLQPQGDGFAREWEWSSWGPGADARFGARLRMAADGPWLLVADTDRHRVVWLDWTKRVALGQLGEADRAGDDLAHLDGPTLVSLRGARAVVGDAGNQRIVKVALAP